jgi:hypothetical protein
VTSFPCVHIKAGELGHVQPMSQQQEVQEWNHRVNDQIRGSCVAHVTAAGSAGAESPGLFIGF